MKRTIIIACAGAYGSQWVGSCIGERHVEIA